MTGITEASYANLPRVRLGQDAGSTAMNLYSFSPRSISPMNGEISPPKLEPPPAQPMMISGLTPYLSSAVFASTPITLLMEKDLVQDAAQHITIARCLHSSFNRFRNSASQASRRTRNSAFIFLPTSVVIEGDGVTLAPYVRITSRRKGFCSYEHFTMNTLQSSPRYAHAMRLLCLTVRHQFLW